MENSSSLTNAYFLHRSDMDLGVIKQAILPTLRIVILCVIKVVANIGIKETDLLFHTIEWIFLLF